MKMSLLFFNVGVMHYYLHHEHSSHRNEYAFSRRKELVLLSLKCPENESIIMKISC